MSELNETKHIIESLLFVADESLSPKKISELIEVDVTTVKNILDTLREEYQAENRGFQIRQVAGGYRFFTHPANAKYVEKLILAWDGRRLTQAALETLSIIAYRQPITKITIGTIRGVNSEGVVSSLMDKGLIVETGRETTPGQPILYGTTKLFLERFGLNSTKDLPPLEEFEPDDTTKSSIEKQLYSVDPPEKVSEAGETITDGTPPESDG